MWCSRFLKDHITRTSYKKCENFSETVFVVNKQVSKQCSCKKNNTFLWIGVTKPVSSENRFWKSDLIWLLLILKPFESWPFYRFDLWGDMNVFKKQQQNNEQSSHRAAGLCQLISPVCVCCINCQFVRISDGFFYLFFMTRLAADSLTGSQISLIRLLHCDHLHNWQLHVKKQWFLPIKRLYQRNHWWSLRVNTAS